MQLIQPGDPEYDLVMDTLEAAGLPTICPEHGTPFQVVGITAADLYEPAPPGAPPGFLGLL